MRKSLTAIEALDTVIASMERARNDSQGAMRACPEMRRMFIGFGWLLDDNLDTIISRATHMREVLSRPLQDVAA